MTGVKSPASLYQWHADVGFLYSNGSWTNLSDPSAGAKEFTLPVSINDRGQVTGDYYNGTTSVGFIATPTDVDHKREPPKLTITDHSLSVSCGRDGSAADQRIGLTIPTTQCQ